MIEITFTLDEERRKTSDAERAVLQQYRGFGIIKYILKSPEIKSDWTKSELDLLPMVASLHRLIRDNSKDGQEDMQYFNSLKSFMLTAFYTPPEVIRAISDTLNENGITPQRFLWPSIGNGAFVDNFKTSFPNMKPFILKKIFSQAKSFRACIQKT